MNITEYTTEVIKRCELLSTDDCIALKNVETMSYSVKHFYEIIIDEPHSSLLFVSKYNDVLNSPFTQKEQMQISVSSGIPGVLVFMIMFFLECKKQDANFSIYGFLLKQGVIKNTLVKEMSEFSID